MVRRRFAAGAVIVIAVLGLLGDASGARGASAEQQRLDPCKLLSRSEVRDALGSTVGSGKKKSGTQGGLATDQCTWRAKKSGTSGVKGKKVGFLISFQTGSRVKEVFDATKQQAGTGSAPTPGAGPVSDLGDDAFNDDFNRLHVLVGDRVLNVAVGPFDTGHWNRTPRQVTIAAAEIVLPRLQA
jgi:hypothetical protein